MSDVRCVQSPEFKLQKNPPTWRETEGAFKIKNAELRIHSAE